MDGSHRSIAWVATALVVGSLAAATPATAAKQLFAAPNGATTGDCTNTPGNPPCKIERAVETNVSEAGDEVTVAPGTHVLTDVLNVNQQLYVHGTDGEPRPRVVSSTGEAVLATINGTRLRHLRLESSASGVGSTLELRGTGTVGEDLVVRAIAASGERDGAELGLGALLRDSLAASTTPEGSAVLANFGKVDLRNVTAFGQGLSSKGIELKNLSFMGICGQGGGDVTAKNVIARGGDADLSPTSANDCSGAERANLNMGFSNYRAERLENVNSTFNDLGGNQTDKSFFFDGVGASGFHQLPGSSTIDAGTPDPLLGPVDFDGEARTIGPAPDIGADEAPDPDADGVFDPIDNCSAAPNPDQANFDGDPQGDACDSDDDNDGVPDEVDAFPLDPTRSTPPTLPDVDPSGATNGDDVLNGTPLADFICGLFGNDTITGLGGDDTLFGDACNKTARAQAAQAPTDGNDRLNGGDGADRLFGAGGNDTLKGGKGNDALFGGAGNDSLKGEAGRDSLDGGAGNDKLDGGKDKNSFKGGAGNDSINARNKKRDSVNCGSGRKDKATVDRVDKVRGCESVKRARR